MQVTYSIKVQEKTVKAVFAPFSSCFHPMYMKEKMDQVKASAKNHRIMELEGVSKAIKSNPLLKAGIQIKADWTEGGPVFL